jgi:hypothetical protein
MVSKNEPSTYLRSDLRTGGNPGNRENDESRKSKTVQNNCEHANNGKELALKSGATEAPQGSHDLNTPLRFLLHILAW